MTSEKNGKISLNDFIMTSMISWFGVLSEIPLILLKLFMVVRLQGTNENFKNRNSMINFNEYIKEIKISYFTLLRISW